MLNQREQEFVERFRRDRQLEREAGYKIGRIMGMVAAARGAGVRVPEIDVAARLTANPNLQSGLAPSAQLGTTVEQEVIDFQDLFPAENISLAREKLRLASSDDPPDAT